MQLGSHFGKRKPRWDFYSSHVYPYMDQIYFKAVRFTLISTVVQLILLTPAVYWTFENYNLFLNLIPSSTKLVENFQDEKKWILFLYICSGAMTFFCNLFFFLKILQPSESRSNLEKFSLSDEVVDQRHAS